MHAWWRIVTNQGYILLFKNKEQLSARYIWLFAFCYATVLSLLFQKFLLPLLPSLHAGSGMLKNDANYFHQSAVTLAENIRLHGWSAWSIWSAQTNTAGNVAILSALYAVFSSTDPALIIPVNAFFHATSATLLFLIGRALCPGRVGNIGGLISAILFVIFPSALSWYSQPLKDSYVIAGVFLVIYAWIKVLGQKSNDHSNKILTYLLQFLWLMMGVLLVAFVKPYYLKLLFVTGVGVTLIVACKVFWDKHPQRFHIVIFYVMATVFVAATSVIIKPAISGVNYLEESLSNGGSGEALQNAGTMPENWLWKKSVLLPDSLDMTLEKVASIRAGFISYNIKVGAGSLIDADAMPTSAAEVLLYLPRSLQIGVLAPFPNAWFQKPNLPRLVAASEMLLWYLIFPGIFLLLYYKRSLPVAVVLMFALFFTTVFGFISPNVGTLYRYRFAYEFLLIVVALCGWAQFILNQLGKIKSNPPALDGAPVELMSDFNLDNPQTSKKKLIGGAATVSLITLIGSLGFFVRDFLMIRLFGTSSQMDVFFLGSMIPMFVVAVIAIPAGSAMIPAYSTLHDDHDTKALSKLVGSMAFFLTLVLAFVSILLYLFTPYLFSVLGVHYDAEKLASICHVMTVYLVIMMLGGLVIIANSVLNAEGRTTFPAAAQLVVPVVVFAAIPLFGATYGIYAVVYGMLAGLIANLALVAYALRGKKLLSISSLKPDVAFALKHLPFHQYVLLVAAALSTALFVPMANALAAHLPSGSVAIIGLGTKVVLLITGVVGIGITTVLLPYFSNLAAKLHHKQAQSDLSFFLLLVTLISVPASLGMMVLAEPMTSFVFSHSALTQDDTRTLIKVIQYGVIQLPFFSCSLIAAKYITAYKHSGIILISSLVGLIIMLLFGVFFSGLMGVSGISLSMTLSVAASATILVCYANHLRHLPFSDSVFIAFNWALFLTLFICLHYHIMVGVVISLIAYVLLVVGNWRDLLANNLLRLEYGM